MAAALADVTTKFEITAHLLPAGDGFDLRGRVKTFIPVTCSFCAHDYKLAINQKFHEIFLIAARKKHSLVEGASGPLDPEIDVTELTEDEINFGEYMREIIALAEPFQPPCEDGDREKCARFEEIKKTFLRDCEEEENMPSSPFAILKNLKTN
jgi:uncharacterized metal-binding protein YceD (DUF177 family)